MKDSLPKRIDAMDTIQFLSPDGSPVAVWYAADLQAAGFFTNRVQLRASLLALVARGALVHLGELAFETTEAGAVAVAATSHRWDENRRTRSQRLAGSDADADADGAREAA